MATLAVLEAARDAAIAELAAISTAPDTDGSDIRSENEQKAARLTKAIDVFTRQINGLSTKAVKVVGIDV